MSSKKKLPKDNEKKPTKINKKKIVIDLSSSDSDISEDSEPLVINHLKNTPNISKVLNTQNANAEWTPDMKDKMWKKYNNNLDEYSGEMPNVEYSITDDLLKKVKTFKNVDAFKNNNESEYDILRVYKIYDSELSSVTIGYGKNTIYNILVSELYYTLEDRPNTKFNTYTNKNIKLTDLTIKMLGMYRTKKSTNVISDMIKIKKSYDESTSKTIYQQPSKFDAKEYLNELLEGVKLPIKKYYVQKIYSKNEPDDMYIFGDYAKLGNTDINQYVKNKCIEFCDDKLKTEVISENLVRYETEGMVITDMCSKENDSINCLNILIGDGELIKKRIFMKLQCENMMIDMLSKKYGDAYYVAYIGNDQCKFVFSGIGNVSKKLNEFYSMTYHNEDKYNKLVKFLSTTEWKNIIVKCIEQNINADDVEQRKIEIMNRYDKSTLLNYNDSNDNNDYVSKKELEKVKSLCFSMRKKI